jgi:molybdopterin synthase sulfur carrier subunit
MKVYIPTPLRSYTKQQSEVDGHGATVAEVLADLDLRFPSIRFRMINEQGGIRQHIRIFINGEEVKGLDVSLVASDEVHILQALSGG